MIAGCECFQNKAVIVTGGGGDIGTATVRMLLERGAKVAVFDHSAEALEKVAAGSARSDRLFTRTCDVTSEDDVKSCFADAHAQFGTVHGIVNAAGIEGQRG
ncbi:MAG: SDR family NAD(P)-dependent oxidoreductase, partial [Sphingobium sp.]